MQWAIGFFGIAILLFLMKNKPEPGEPIPDTQIERIAKAIARAEGFFTDSQLLQRLHNPVGLKPVGGGSLIQFPTEYDGWQAAYRQIRLILTNQSSVYNKDMSIAQIAPLWTGGDKPDEWALIVSSQLGIDKNEPIFKA